MQLGQICPRGGLGFAIVGSLKQDKEFSGNEYGFVHG